MEGWVWCKEPELTAEETLRDALHSRGPKVCFGLPGLRLSHLEIGCKVGGLVEEAVRRIGGLSVREGGL